MKEPNWEENINDLIAAYVGHSSSENYKVLMKKIRSTIKQAQEEAYRNGYKQAVQDRKTYKEKIKEEL